MPRKAKTAPSIETIPTEDLKPHPRNYRVHPEDQIEHIAASIREHGLYRSVVIAKDGTILAGHGIVEAAATMGISEMPVYRLDVESDSDAALKVLTGDNYLSHLAENDDRALTEILKEINESSDLIGTGFDEHMLATLVMVTRPTTEIKNMDAAAEWVGMPDFEAGEEPFKLNLQFETEEERERLVKEISLIGIHNRNGVWSAWWPPRHKTDSASVRFEPATDG